MLILPIRRALILIALVLFLVLGVSDIAGRSLDHEIAWLAFAFAALTLALAP